MALSVLVLNYFDQYSGVATGLQFVGWSLSGLLFPKIFSFLEENYGIQGTLLIYSGMAMHCTAFALLVRDPPWVSNVSSMPPPAPRQRKTETNNSAETVHKKLHYGSIVNVSIPPEKEKLADFLYLFKRPIFYALVVYCTWADYSLTAVSPTLVDHIMDRGFSKEKAENIIVYTAASELAGRLVIPLLADRKLLGRSTLVMINFFLMAATSFVLPEVDLYPHVVTVCVVQSLFFGCVTTMRTVLFADHIGIHRVSVSIGFAGMLMLPFIVINPAIIGKNWQSLRVVLYLP